MTNKVSEVTVIVRKVGARLEKLAVGPVVR